MTWSLSAAGHAAEELEREIVEKLREVLVDPRFGAAAFRFVGDFVSHDLLHTAPLETAPAVQEQPSAQKAPAQPEPSAPAEPAAATDAKAATPKADPEPEPAATQEG